MGPRSGGEIKVSDPAPQKQGGCFAAIGMAVVAILALFGALIVVGLFASQNASAPTRTAPQSAWTPPSGFQLTETDSFRPVRVGYRWLENREFSCDYGDMCFGAEFVSEKPCDFFYAALSLLDSSGANVGMTNDTTTGVKEGQRVVMVFRTYEKRARAAELSRVSCS